MSHDILQHSYLVRRTPLAFTLLIIILGIFLSELFAMTIVHKIWPTPFPLAAFLDDLIMIGLVFPIVYFFSIRPLITYIAEINRIEKQMRLQITVLRTSTNGVVITDKDGNIMWVNPAFTQMTGYSYEEVIGKNPRLLKSDKQDAVFYKQLWDTILSGQTWKGEIVNQRKDGSLYIEEQIIAPSLDERGEIINFVSVRQDITERVQIEQQLKINLQERLALSASEQSQHQLADGLAQATLALNESPDIETVLDRIFEQARRIIPFSGANVALLNEENILQIVQAWGFEDRPEMYEFYRNTCFAIKDFPILEAISRSLKPVLVEDSTLAPEWVSVPGLEWVRTELLAPLVIDGRLTGLVNMVSDQPGAFTPEMVDRITAFSVPAAIAIQLARSYAAEQHARQVADILSAASLALTQSLDINVVLDRMLEHTQHLVPFDEGAVAILENRQQFKVCAVRGCDERPAPAELLNRVFSIQEWPHFQAVIDTRKTMLIHNTHEYPGWHPFFGSYAQNWLGIPLHFDENTIGILVVIKASPGFFTQEHVQFAEALVGQASVVIQNAWLFSQVRSFNERLQFLSHRLVEVQENQLRYIAQELHDEVGQVLTSLILGLQMIEKAADQPEAVRAGTVEMGKALDIVMENLHRLSMDLHPTSLDHLGLEAALRQHVETINDKFSLKIQFEMIGIKQRLPAQMEIALYRIVQEALNNIIRHASASRADVLIQMRDGNLVLIVEDNGMGFDPAIAMQGDRLGLFGIRERSEMLGGKLIIESASGQGTTIVVEVPYAN